MIIKCAEKFPAKETVFNYVVKFLVFKKDHWKLLHSSNAYTTVRYFIDVICKFFLSNWTISLVKEPHYNFFIIIDYYQITYIHNLSVNVFYGLLISLYLPFGLVSLNLAYKQKGKITNTLLLQN